MVPYLCGGIFLLLLKQAKADGLSNHQLINGQRDNRSMEKMTLGLIKLFYPVDEHLSGRTFSTDSSEYRSCKKNSSGYLPFNDSVLIGEYDKKVQENFLSALSDMNNYVQTYLDVKSSSKINWLGRALLNLLKQDTEINDNETLFYCERGITKSKLLDERDINVPALLLAIWHFIVTRRPENTKGRETFLAWNEEPKINGNPWVFNNDIGKNYPYEVKFDVSASEISALEISVPTREEGENMMQETTDQVKDLMKVVDEEDKSSRKTIMFNLGSGQQINEVQNLVINNSRCSEL